MKIALATLLLLLATAVGLVEVLSIVDPVGLKMADDGDPRGDPGTSWLVHGICSAIMIASVGGALLLLRKRPKD